VGSVIGQITAFGLANKLIRSELFGGGILRACPQDSPTEQAVARSCVNPKFGQEECVVQRNLAEIVVTS
jgi:hypothetical protein